MSVIGALGLDQDTAPGRGPGDADRLHCRLGPRVGEPDPVQPEAPAQLGGQRDRGRSHRREVGAVPGRPVDRLHDLRVRMTADSDTEPVVVVEVRVAVNVPQPGPGAAGQVHRVRLHRLEGGSHPEWQVGRGLLEHAGRLAGALSKPLALGRADFAGSCS